MVIESYRAEHIAAVRAFNHRLREGGEADFAFPEDAVPDWLPKQDGRRIFQEFFLARDESGVHGGYIIKQQDFSIRGATVPVGYYHLPLSEGIVNKSYGLLGAQLLVDAMRRQPLMYALGMGGFDRPLPRMLKGIGWKMREVPFYFKVNRPVRFLRNIRPLRRTLARRVAFDALAYSGAGSVAIRLLQGRAPRRVDFEVVSEFSSWADQLWESARRQAKWLGRGCSHVKCAVSTGKRAVHAHSSRFARMAVVLDTEMRDHKYFGDMRVGTVADCFAAPDDASAVIAAATEPFRHAALT
jgi:hypothetical protein